jgi:molybdopterin molybdotransferase
MITVEEASLLISKYVSNWNGESAFAQDLYSDRNYPPFHRVMMDGIAVNFEVFQSGLRVFPILGISPAGQTAKELKDSKGCFEVMTGAPLPKGADLVIQYEHLKIENGFAHVTVDSPRERFDSVHLEGSDCKSGDIVLSAGASLNGPHAGIAASIGHFNLSLERKPKIMIISTGDELVEKDQKPLEHQIRRSNVYALQTSLQINGHENILLDHLDDRPQRIADHYNKNAADFDLMIYSGGVSKGKYDYLPNIWMELGVKKHFHGISQRPGKPLWFGTDEKLSTAIVGLPGNPVSSLVCLHRYIIAGRAIYARLSEEVIFKKDLTYFLPVKIVFTEDGILSATPLQIKNSGEFTALAGSDGFIELPKQQSTFSAGEAFRFYPWRNF